MAGSVGTGAVIATIIVTGLLAAGFVLAVRVRTPRAVGAGAVGAGVAIGEGAAEFFHGALELLHLGAEFVVS